jgi:PiT family inorganic phosphate transporter
MGLWVAIGFALCFSITNGFHDAANAIATLVATRGARPAQAVFLSAVFNILGTLLLGTAVADTVAGIVTVSPGRAITVIGAGAAGAAAWNLITWWRGLPSSSGHALVGGLSGAAFASSGLYAVQWGGMHGFRPAGVIGVLIVLAVSPILGFIGGDIVARGVRLGTRRASREIAGPVRVGEYVATAALSFSHGGNDGQKSMGLIAGLLLAAGHTHTLSVPLWVKLACGVTLTFGTALGGWRIVRTIGRRIYRMRPVDAFASQTGSTAVVLGASLLGAPVSTTHVVAASVIGVGSSRGRRRHVRWSVVESMAAAWVLTLPAAGLLGAAVFFIADKT